MIKNGLMLNMRTSEVYCEEWRWAELLYPVGERHEADKTADGSDFLNDALDEIHIHFIDLHADQTLLQGGKLWNVLKTQNQEFVKADCFI